MAWLIRRNSASRAELAAVRSPVGSPVHAAAAVAGLPWGALVPEGPTSSALLPVSYPLVARTVHVGRTVNPLCALNLPLPQGAPPRRRHGAQICGRACRSAALRSGALAR